MYSFRTFVTGCATALLCSAPLLAASTTIPRASQTEAKEADTLLSQMKDNAQVIQQHAVQLEKLSQNSNAQWSDFDRQWNEIKPAQEAMDMEMWRLESMRSSLTNAQRKSLDQVKEAARMVSYKTRQLFEMVDQRNADLQSARFRADARSLSSNAGAIMRGV